MSTQKAQKDFLLSSYLSKSFPRNKNSYFLHKTKIICFLLVILSILIPLLPVRCHAAKRDSTCITISSSTTPINTLFCSPTENAGYQINQTVNLSWNPSNNLLLGIDQEKQVVVFLYRLGQNVSGITEQIALNSTNSTAGLIFPLENNSENFLIGPGWLPKNAIPNRNYTFYFRVTPTEGSDNSNPVYNTPTFNVLAPVPVPISTTSSFTPMSTPISTLTSTILIPTSGASSVLQNGKLDNNSNSLIALMAVASVAAFLAFVAIVISLRSRKRGNQAKQQSLSTLSASSSTPMIKFGSNDRDSEPPATAQADLEKVRKSSAEAESTHSTAPLSNKEEMRLKPNSFSSNENQPISASDAVLLSDAFRKGLRKPDWKPEDEEDDDSNLSQEEHLRRREAKELMKKELAEEGTDLQNISVGHTKIEICNINDEQEGGASRLSESGSK